MTYKDFAAMGSGKSAVSILIVRAVERIYDLNVFVIVLHSMIEFSPKESFRIVLSSFLCSGLHPCTGAHYQKQGAEQIRKISGGRSLPRENNLYITPPYATPY